MTAPTLHVVGPGEPVEPLSARIRRQWTGARSDACDHVDQLRAALAEVARIAGEIASGPAEAYSVGAREIARQLADDVTARVTQLGAMNERARAS